MSNQKTLKGTHNAIFSQESGDGVEHCNSQDGEQTDLFGQEARLASLSLSQENNKEQTTNDTCGPSGSILSESADLQSYLESRLAPLSDTDGLIPYKKTWKQKTTPAQRRYCQLQVSVLSKKGTGSGSWPTPLASDARGSAGKGKKELPNIAKLTDWLTPTTSDMNGTRKLDGKRSGGLNTQATLVNWPTPQARDYKGSSGRSLKGQEFDLPTAAILPTQVTGITPNKSTAEMVRSDSSQLNPRFSLWLMGYPIEWAYCAERVTPLSRRSQRKS